MAWADEMRVGLVSVVRRVWAPRGVKVRQRVQQVREWRYLVVALEVQAGHLWWCWTDSMQGETTASVVSGWQRNTNLDRPKADRRIVTVLDDQRQRLDSCRRQVQAQRSRVAGPAL